MSTTASITRPPGLMHNPPHPGEVLRDGWLQDMSVTDAAARLDVTRKTLSEILNGHAGISAEMALRLAKGLGTTAEFWSLLQMHYDLWQAQRHVKSVVARVTPFSRPRPAMRANPYIQHAQRKAVRIGGRARRATRRAVKPKAKAK